MTAANTVANKSYSALVSAARDLARDGLRTRNIRAQVEVIAGLKLEKSSLLSDAEALVKGSQYELDVATFELKKFNLDKELGNPDFADSVKELEENVKCATEALAKVTKLLTDLNAETTEGMVYLNEQIKLANEKIGRWETGENKVQLENLNALAKEYIETALHTKAKALSAVLG